MKSKTNTFNSCWSNNYNLVSKEFNNINYDKIRDNIGEIWQQVFVQVYFNFIDHI